MSEDMRPVAEYHWPSLDRFTNPYDVLWRARCSCGWRGAFHDALYAAEAESKGHLHAEPARSRGLSGGEGED